MVKTKIKPEIKERLLAINKIYMIFKVHIKANKDADKRPLKSFKKIIRLLKTGIIEGVDEQIAKLKNMVFGQENKKTDEKSDAKSVEDSSLENANGGNSEGSK